MYTQLRSRTKQLVVHAQTLKFQVLDSELEALLIEAELIRTHQPPYNIALKDDKTPLYILITNETYSRVMMVRKREVQKKQVPKGTLLGPFPSSYRINEVLKIAREIFPWCSTPGAGRPCFYYHLDLCPGACIGSITPEDYQQNMQHLILFLKGKKKDVVHSLEAEMKTAVATEKFEVASMIRDSLNNIKIVTQSNYLLRPNPTLPSLKLNQAEESLIQLRQLLRNYMELPKDYPLHRIEGYDVSNISGQNAAVSMVTAINGTAANTEYRLFNIKTIHQPNDYAMLQEAIQRRQNHPEWGIPNLIVIDGGKGQLRAALSVCYWPIPMISIAKKPDRLIIPVGLSLSLGPTGEPVPLIKRIPAPIQYQELKLAETNLPLRLIQRLRDEAHRFSKKQQSNLGLRKLFE